MPIIEDMQARLDAIEARQVQIVEAIQKLAAGGAAPAPTPTPAPTPAADPFGLGATPTPAPAVTVTPDMIPALITPHLENPTVKDALLGQLKAMGINSLPEVAPHQLTDVYNRFKAVIDAHLANSGGAAAGAASII